MLWNIFKYYMCFVVAVFFKRSKIKNAHHIKVPGPVIIAMNHPNAFMDPIAFTTIVYPPRVRYLARGDAFKKGIITSILESLGIIPIFRMQDAGKEGLKKNNETYDRVNQLLKNNQKIIIFAEGLCIQERRLRPLKKGVPRMVFGAMETHNLKDLTVVPVGVNYSKPSNFRGNIFFNIGTPIKVSDYMSAYNESQAKTMNQFLADLTPKMKELIVHINHPHNEQLIEHIEEVYKSDFFRDNQLNEKNIEHDFIFSSYIVKVINEVEGNTPKKLIDLSEKTTKYFEALKKYALKDWLLQPTKQSQINYAYFSLRLLIIIACIPLYIRGVLGSFIPYYLTALITKKKVKVVEFKASFLIGIGAILFLIYGLIQFFIAKAFAPNAWWALLVLVVTVLTGLFCLWYSPFRKKTAGIYKVLQLKRNHTAEYTTLQKLREEIINDVAQLCVSSPYK